MLQQLSIGPLVRAEAAQALPLIRSLRPDMSLEEWQSYLDLVTDGGGEAMPIGDPPLAGVVAVRDDDGYLHGLFTYSVAEDIIHGRALQVDNMVAADMLGRDLPARMMIEEMERLAEQHSCGAVHVIVNDDRAMPPRPASSMLARLRETGHVVDGVRMCREVHVDGGRSVGAEE